MLLEGLKAASPKGEGNVLLAVNRGAGDWSTSAGAVAAADGRQNSYYVACQLQLQRYFPWAAPAGCLTGRQV